MTKLIYHIISLQLLFFAISGPKVSAQDISSELKMDPLLALNLLPVTDDVKAKRSWRFKNSNAQKATDLHILYDIGDYMMNREKTRKAGLITWPLSVVKSKKDGVERVGGVFSEFPRKGEGRLGDVDNTIAPSMSFSGGSVAPGEEIEIQFYHKINIIKWWWSKDPDAFDVYIDKDGRPVAKFDDDGILGDVQDVQSDDLNAMYDLKSAPNTNFVLTGTGSTTGYVANGEITNNNDFPIIIYICPMFVPSVNDKQPYVILDRRTVTVPADSAIIIKFKEGVCVDVTKDPSGLGEAMASVDQIILEHEITEVVESSFHPSSSSVFVKRNDPDQDSIFLNDPVTGLPTDYVLDPGENPHHYGEIVLDRVIEIDKTLIDLRLEDNLHTPWSSVPEKEHEGGRQHVSWLITAELTGSTFKKKDVDEKITEQIEEASGMTISSMPEETQEEIGEGLEDWWNAVLLVAEKPGIVTSVINDENLRLELSCSESHFVTHLPHAYTISVENQDPTGNEIPEDFNGGQVVLELKRIGSMIPGYGFEGTRSGESMEFTCPDIDSGPYRIELRINSEGEREIHPTDKILTPYDEEFEYEYEDLGCYNISSSYTNVNQFLMSNNVTFCMGNISLDSLIRLVNRLKEELKDAHAELENNDLVKEARLIQMVLEMISAPDKAKELVDKWLRAEIEDITTIENTADVIQAVEYIEQLMSGLEKLDKDRAEKYKKIRKKCEQLRENYLQPTADAEAALEQLFEDLISMLTDFKGFVGDKVEEYLSEKITETIRNYLIKLVGAKAAGSIISIGIDIGNTIDALIAKGEWEEAKMLFHLAYFEMLKRVYDEDPTRRIDGSFNGREVTVGEKTEVIPPYVWFGPEIYKLIKGKKVSIKAYVVCWEQKEGDETPGVGDFSDAKPIKFKDGSYEKVKDSFTSDCETQPRFNYGLDLEDLAREAGDCKPAYVIIKVFVDGEEIPQSPVFIGTFNKP